MPALKTKRSLRRARGRFARSSRDLRPCVSRRAGAPPSCRLFGVRISLQPGSRGRDTALEHPAGHALPEAAKTAATAPVQPRRLWTTVRRLDGFSLFTRIASLLSEPSLYTSRAIGQLEHGAR